MSEAGVTTLEAIFSAMDQKGDQKLDVDDFRWGLMDFGIQLSKDEATQLLEKFDIDKNGTVNYKEFITTITPKPAENQEEQPAAEQA